MLKIRSCVIFSFFAGLTLFLSCNKGNKVATPLISIVIPYSGFKVAIGDSLPLNPTVVNNIGSTYSWSVNGIVVSSAKIFTFTPIKIGNYTIQLKVTNEIGSDDISILVSTFSNNSPYITKVFDYQYGPGQIAAIIPTDWKGNDFIGQPWTGTKSYTSLGGWGGYLIAGFDHTVKNVDGADFGIYTQPGAGSEPGVVYVMYDANKDGIPNDGDWAEIKAVSYTHLTLPTKRIV